VAAVSQRHDLAGWQAHEVCVTPSRDLLQIARAKVSELEAEIFPDARAMRRLFILKNLSGGVVDFEFAIRFAQQFLLRGKGARICSETKRQHKECKKR
jgi:hypothetical protein